jgi:hypothetical protein
MALLGSEVEVISFSIALLLMLLNAYNALGQQVQGESDDDYASSIDRFNLLGEDYIMDVDRFAAAALYNVRLCIIFYLLDEDLGFWVKPRSTTWFSRFLLGQYGEERWIQMFRLTKPFVFALSNLLKPHVQK